MRVQVVLPNITQQMAAGYRLFLLSPARLGGKRAEVLLNPGARFDLARRLQNGDATLGEVFSFLSGLYFRGKLAYANAFARPYGRLPGVWVITSDRGLVAAEAPVSRDDLLASGTVDIDPSEARYTRSLRASATRLLQLLPPPVAGYAGLEDVILLGSVGTKKYVELLLEVFGDRLKFPQEFVGRGDMSRGGLLLRCVAAGVELNYVQLLDAIRHGKRPPKLPPRR